MILIVCEGNVCRSPIAAGLLRRALAGRSIEVRSAGTHALVDQPAQADSVTVARWLGLDLDAHRGLQVTPELVSESTMILTATRGIRSDVVALHAPAVQRTFTIRQLGRILASAPEPFLADGGTEAEQLAAVAAYTSRHRGVRPAVDPTADDVIDPVRRPIPVHEQAVQQMIPGLNSLAYALHGTTIRWPAK